MLNIKLAKNISDELELFCDETGVTKTMAVEKILHQYLEQYFEREENERKIFK